MNRVHVATGAPLDKPGGLHRYVMDLARAQIAQGDRVAVIHKVSRLGTFEVHPDFDDLSPVTRDEPPLIHFHFAPSALAFSTRHPRAFPGSRTVFHFHGPWADEGTFQGNSPGRVAAKRGLERIVYGRQTSFLTASHAFAKVLSEGYRVEEARVRAVVPGVDTGRFTPTSDRREARQRFGLSQDHPVIGAVRRLEPRMGLDHAIRALHHLSKPDVELAIVGGGSQEGHLRVLAGELGLSERVRFLGRLDDEELPSFYSCLDASVVPTIGLEGFGLVVLESFACGVPVVATQCDGLVEAMGPFAPKFTCAPGDDVELASVIDRVLEEPPPVDELVTYAHSLDSLTFAGRIDAALEDLGLM